MTDKVFKASDELISLVSDDNVPVTIKKGRLMKRTVYFKNMFSDISSNKNDSSFGFNVSTKALLLYRQYVKTGKLTNEMYKDDDFMSLADRLGTKGLDADVHLLTVVEPMETRLRGYADQGYDYRKMIAHALKNGLIPIEEADLIMLIAEVMSGPSYAQARQNMRQLNVLKRNPLYETTINHMLETINASNYQPY